jgi:hypothetical protein
MKLRIGRRQDETSRRSGAADHPGRIRIAIGRRLCSFDNRDIIRSAGAQMDRADGRLEPSAPDRDDGRGGRADRDRL